MVIIAMIIFMLWWIISLTGTFIYSVFCTVKHKKINNTRYNKNPIDVHGDYNYGTIDWLKNGKL